MGKGKRGGTESGEAAPAGQPEGGDAAPVLNLKMDSTTGEAPKEVATTGGFEVPCTITGLGAGLRGGSLGWVFGFGGYWIRSIRSGERQWKMAMGAGWQSAQTFAIMGGLYAAVSCFMQRLRQKNDAWNGAASGCATGLALGWQQGPLSALQSCAMLGFFSYFVDSSVGSEAQAAAHAPAAAPSGGGDGGGGTPQQLEQRQRWQQQRAALERALAPAVPLLAALAPCAFAVEEGSGSPAGGCRVLRRR